MHQLAQVLRENTSLLGWLEVQYAWNHEEQTKLPLPSSNHERHQANLNKYIKIMSKANNNISSEPNYPFTKSHHHKQS